MKTFGRWIVVEMGFYVFTPKNIYIFSTCQSVYNSKEHVLNPLAVSNTVYIIASPGRIVILMLVLRFFSFRLHWHLYLVCVMKVVISLRVIA